MSNMENILISHSKLFKTYINEYESNFAMNINYMSLLYKKYYKELF